MLVLSGCAASGPAATAESFLDALKSGDDGSASEMLEDESDLDIAAMSSDMSQLDNLCKIGEAQEDDAVSATFRVSCPSYQMDMTVNLNEDGKVHELVSEVLGSDTSS